jgi:4-amino-4-deoxy-L-arabinose transferase-like glycosyltransferase
MRRFGGRLGVIAAAAFALRLVHAVWFAPRTSGIFDAFYFEQLARLLAEGHGFVSPHAFLFEHRSIATADHPPLYPLALAAVTKLLGGGDTLLRACGAVFGAATVALVGLIGRRAQGELTGLLAAGIAAVYPLLITADGAVLSETLYLPLVALSLLLAYRLAHRPTVTRALALGAAIGAATLTRSEALLLLVLLALPAARLGRERWARSAALCAIAAVVVVSPWLVRNWIVFDRPLLSNNEGGLVAQTNCEEAYSGARMGYLAPSCLGPRVGRDEAAQAAHWRRQGLDYARDHLSRLPAVLAVRGLRVWGLWQPGGGQTDAESRNKTVQTAGLLAFYPLLALALFGAVSLRRRGEPLALLLAPEAVVTLVALASYGSVRLRTAAELPMVVLAAVALSAWSASWRPRPLSSRRDG